MGQETIETSNKTEWAVVVETENRAQIQECLGGHWQNLEEELTHRMTVRNESRMSQVSRSGHRRVVPLSCGFRT